MNEQKRTHNFKAILIKGKQKKKKKIIKKRGHKKSINLEWMDMERQKKIRKFYKKKIILLIPIFETTVYLVTKKELHSIIYKYEKKNTYKKIHSEIKKIIKENKKWNKK